MIRVHEYKENEEFYARFIQIQGSEHSVLVFNYGDGARELAESIASLMGDEWSWFEGTDMQWQDLDD